MNTKKKLNVIKKSNKKSNKKKNIKIQKNINKQKGGYKESKISLNFEFVITLSSNITRKLVFFSTMYNPSNVFRILEHLNASELNYCQIEGRPEKLFLKDLKLRKARMGGFAVTHYFMILYFDIHSEKYSVAIFGGNGVGSIYNFVITFPDTQIGLLNYKDKEKDTLSLRVPLFKNEDRDIVDVTTTNIKYLLNLFYIYNFTLKYCPNCKNELDYDTPNCKICSALTFGIKFAINHRELRYYRKPFDVTDMHNYTYYILYGRFKLYANEKSLNCQSFTNFFINLMRGNPFRWSCKITNRYTVVERRLLVMHYLSQINVLFMNSNKELMTKEYIDMFNGINKNYDTLLSRFYFYSYLRSNASKLETKSDKKFYTAWRLLRYIKGKYVLPGDGKTEEAIQDRQRKTIENIEFEMAEQNLNQLAKMQQLEKESEETQVNTVQYIEKDLEDSDDENEETVEIGSDSDQDE